MAKIIPAIFMLVGALLLTPWVFAAALLGQSLLSGRGASVAAIAPEPGLLLLGLVPVSGLALIWVGFRGLKRG